MASIYLTEDQRLQASLEKQYRKISDGLAVLKNREQITQAQMAKGLGVDQSTVSKLLGSESVRLDVMMFLKVLRAAGLKVVPRETVDA